MKMRKQDIELFKSLRENYLGKRLREYCEYVQGCYGNINTMEHSDLQARRDALKIIEDEFITRLKS